MKTLCWLALTVLLGFVSVETVATSARATLEDKLENRADRGTDTLVPQVPGVTALIAVITDIDREHGVVSLDTELGQIVTFADPKDLQQLHTGDQIVLYVVDEDPNQTRTQEAIRV